MGNFLVAALFFLTPFLQLGVSYYFSAQVACIVGLLFVVANTSLQRKALLLVALGGGAFLVKAFVEMPSFDMQEILLVFREAFCFSLLVLAVRRIADLDRPASLLRGYYFFLAISVVLVCVQFLAIRGGSFISFPFGWFIANSATLIGVDEALEYGTRLRPVGFYGEPSYMAFVIISALTVFLSVDKVRLKVVIFVLVFNLIALFLLSSLAGALAFFLIVVVYFSRRDLSGVKITAVSKILIVGVAVLVGVGVLSVDSEFSRRIGAMFSGEGDMSIYIRYVVPVFLLKDMFLSGHLFGYSGGEIVGLAQGYGVESIDNALFYLLLHYGLLAPLLIALLVRHVRYSMLVAYALIVLNFNGAYFSFDKVVVMSLTLGLSLGLLRRARGGRCYEIRV